MDTIIIKERAAVELFEDLFKHFRSLWIILKSIAEYNCSFVCTLGFVIQYSYPHMLCVSMHYSREFCVHVTGPNSVQVSFSLIVDCLKKKKKAAIK